MGLDLNNFKTVFDDNFGNDSSLNWSLWGARWGNSDQFSFGNGALTLTSSAWEGWKPVGFLQQPSGKSAGEGYGLFQFTGYANAGQGTGISFEMWRADNVWLDSSKPGVATEMDLLETQGGRAFSTIHWYDSGWSNNDGQQSHTLNIDVSKSHTYAIDWERGSLTYYIDGQEIYQDTTHAPLDAADGGSNEVMGAQVVNAQYGPTTPSVQLHITDMSYSTATSGGTSNPTPTPTPTPAPTGGSQIGASASGPLAFQVDQSGSAFTINVQKEVGATATMREFIDNRYMGTVIDNFKDGNVSGIAVSSLSAGSHNITLTLDGNSNYATANFTVAASQSSSTASTPVFISGNHVATTLVAGQTLNDTGVQSTLTLPAAGGVTLNGNTVNNDDSFDVRAAMATTNWHGQSADLSAYLTSTTTNGGKDMQVLLHPQGGSASSLLATVSSVGQDASAFLRFEQHALLR